METYSGNDSNLSKVIGSLLSLVIGLVIILVGFTAAFIYYTVHTNSKEKIETSSNPQNSNAILKQNDAGQFWNAPSESDLQYNSSKELIEYGKDIIVHTAQYFGPEGLISKDATNGLNCQNCHLEAGTKTYGNNYSAVASTYPKYRARSGAVENIYKRVNDCFERSLDGNALDTNSKEMQAIVAYINWLGKDVAKGEKPKGSGLKKMNFLDRAANPSNGKILYAEKCQTCHQKEGEGTYNAESKSYLYPPLWGKNSYNDGAGLYRISNFAMFIKSNMPLGASHENPILTDEEAWDIAAFVNSQNRPHADIRKDWPKISEKPFDHPFGSFADTFSQNQHKYGPYNPIIKNKNALTKN